MDRLKGLVTNKYTLHQKRFEADAILILSLRSTPPVWPVEVKEKVTVLH